MEPPTRWVLGHGGEGSCPRSETTLLLVGATRRTRPFVPGFVPVAEGPRSRRALTAPARHARGAGSQPGVDRLTADVELGSSSGRQRDQGERLRRRALVGDD